MAMTMVVTKNSDWGKLYYYATELAFDHGLDLPEDIDKWSDKRLRSYIARIEKQYGKLSAIG